MAVDMCRAARSCGRREAEEERVPAQAMHGLRVGLRDPKIVSRRAARNTATRREFPKSEAEGIVSKPGVGVRRNNCIGISPE